MSFTNNQRIDYKQFHIARSVHKGGGIAAVWVEENWLKKNPGVYKLTTKAPALDGSCWNMQLTWNGKIYHMVSPATKPLREICDALHLKRSEYGSDMAKDIINCGKFKIATW